MFCSKILKILLFSDSLPNNTKYYAIICSGLSPLRDIITMANAKKIGHALQISLMPV